MSTTALTGLRDYLYSTLSPANLVWLGTQLTEYGNRQKEQVKPYTIEELHERVAQAERDFAEGRYLTSEEIFSDLDKEFHFLEKEETEKMAL